MAVKKARTLAEREKKRREAEAEQPSSETTLYRRDPKERRVMILELRAWSVHQAELMHDTQLHTSGEAGDFRDELRATRERTWGIRPWRGIEDDDRFQQYVLDIAETFANANGVGEAWYPNRSHQLDGAENTDPESY